jgi:hypothetical protein
VRCTTVAPKLRGERSGSDQASLSRRARSSGTADATARDDPQHGSESALRPSSAANSAVTFGET